MKKFFVIVLAGCMMLSLVACGKQRTTIETSNWEEKVVEESEVSMAATESSKEEHVEAKAELPKEFVISEYDEEFFQPITNDYLIISYNLPISLAIPEWFNLLGQMAYGPTDIMKESTVNVTKMAYFEGDNLKGAKIRLAYASSEDAMSACTIRECYLIPEELGLPNQKDDSLITAEYLKIWISSFLGHFQKLCITDLRRNTMIILIIFVILKS